MSNKLQVVQKELAAAGSVKAMFALPLVQDRFITNYAKTTGKTDGIQRFEQEVLNFLEIGSQNPAILKCDRFSIFAAIVKAGTTGLSFRDGHLYPIPYGNTLKTSIGAHGKREMLMRMPTIEFVSEAQLVMKNDKFVYDKANSIVMEHPVDMMKKVDLTIENIMGAYFRIEFTGGRVIDVLMTQDELLKAKAASKSQGGPWKSWPGEMCKKSVYNRGYKLYHRYPEGEYNAFPEYDDDSETKEPAPAPAPAKKSEEKKAPAKPAEAATDDIEEANVIDESPESSKTPPPKKEGDIF